MYVLGAFNCVPLSIVGIRFVTRRFWPPTVQVFRSVNLHGRNQSSYVACEAPEDCTHELLPCAYAYELDR